MRFGQALDALNQGKRATRRGWNGKGMFIVYTPGEEVPISAIRSDILRYTLQSAGKSTVRLNSHFDMKAADGSIVIGWLASQTDLQADDWEVLE